MNLQDNFPYHSTIVGLDNKYIAFKDSFYINNDCIDLPDKTINKDVYCNLIEYNGDNTQSYTIQMKEVFCFEGIVYILFIDLRNLKVALLDIDLNSSLKRPDWKITNHSGKYKG